MISSKPNHTFPVGFLQEKPGLELLMDDLIWPILYDFLLKNTKVVIAQTISNSLLDLDTSYYGNPGVTVK